jgi:hypothetical protein
LSYRIVYKPDRENGTADALSQQPHVAELAAMMVDVPVWLSQVCQSYQKDTAAQELIEKILNHAYSVPDFEYQDGLIRKAGRIWLGSDTEVHRLIMHSARDSKVGGILERRQHSNTCTVLLFGTTCADLCRNMSVNATSASRQIMNTCAILDFFSPCMCLNKLGTW